MAGSSAAASTGATSSATPAAKRSYARWTKEEAEVFFNALHAADVSTRADIRTLGARVASALTTKNTKQVCEFFSRVVKRINNELAPLGAHVSLGDVRDQRLAVIAMWSTRSAHRAVQAGGGSGAVESSAALLRVLELARKKQGIASELGFVAQTPAASGEGARRVGATPPTAAPARLELQLYPMDDVVNTALEHAGLVPLLELTFRPGKGIPSIVAHLETKWAAARANLPGGGAGYQLHLYRYDAVDETSRPRWSSVDVGVTASGIFDSLGRPSPFRLKYAWAPSAGAAPQLRAEEGSACTSVPAGAPRQGIRADQGALTSPSFAESAPATSPRVVGAAIGFGQTPAPSTAMATPAVQTVPTLQPPHAQGGGGAVGAVTLYAPRDASDMDSDEHWNLDSCLDDLENSLDDDDEPVPGADIPSVGLSQVPAHGSAVLDDEVHLQYLESLKLWGDADADAPGNGLHDAAVPVGEDVEGRFVEEVGALLGIDFDLADGDAALSEELSAAAPAAAAAPRLATGFGPRNGKPKGAKPKPKAAAGLATPGVQKR